MRHLDARHWRNGWQLVAPPRVLAQPKWALVVVDGGVPVKCIVAGDGARGSIEPTLAGLGAKELAAYADALADVVSEIALARDWQAQYKRVLAAVEERFAKPSLALFLERATLRDVLVGPNDQLARELNAKRVVIDPAPAWLLGLLGGAAVA